MGRRQRKRLLRRRRAATAAHRAPRRTAVVTGAAFGGAASLVAPLLAPPAVSAPVDPAGPLVQLLGEVVAGPPGGNPLQAAAWREGVLFKAGPSVAERRLWHAGPDGVRPVFDEPPFDETTVGFDGPLPRPGGEGFWLTAERPGTPGVRSLWLSDGTDAGTQELASADAGSSYEGLELLAEVDGTLYFTALGQPGDDGPAAALWATDGTPAGTREVAELPGDAMYTELAAVSGDRLFFTTHGYEEYDQGEVALWATDGTPAGTRVLRTTQFYDGGMDAWQTAGGLLFFRSGDRGRGEELWRSDGTEAGTGRVADLRPGRKGSVPATLMDVGGTLVLQTTSPRNELWRTDGTRKGTQRIRKLPGRTSNHNGLQAVSHDGLGFFMVQRNGAQRGKVNDLWRTDGTKAGTKRLTSFDDADIHKGEGGVERGSPFVVAGGRVWFTARKAGLGVELWSSDGTSKGTGPVVDLRPGPGDGRPIGLVAVDDRLHFFGSDGAVGREPWRVLPDEALLGPVVAAPAKQAQPRGKVRVKVRVGAGETVSALVRAKVAVKGTGRHVTLRKRVQVPLGERTVVKLVAPRDGRRLAGRATVTVTLRDLAGHRHRQQLTVPLG